MPTDRMVLPSSSQKSVPLSMQKLRNKTMERSDFIAYVGTVSIDGEEAAAHFGI